MADELVVRYRPKRVATLFVGESSPAQGTHFYLANSNLYRAVAEAFAAAFGVQAVGSGEVFLRFFAARGFWLVDLADRPVNRLAGAERRAVVTEGVPRLAEILARTKPKSVIVIKSDIALFVAQALELAGLKKAPTVLALRYPLRQYRSEFVTKLAEFLKMPPPATLA